MKILVLADIHGEFIKAGSVIDKINTKGIDLILCPGDFTDMFNIPEGFSQMDVADMVLQKILSLGIPTLCVPGNHDPYEILELFKEYETNLHARVRDIKGHVFLGFGGAPTPFGTTFEPSEEETREELQRLGKQVKKNNFVLVVHNPPKDTKLDLAATGKHVGSRAIREFIEKKQPLLAISAHIHEAAGLDSIGETTVFYPGCVFNGKYGIVEIKGGSVTCKSMRVR